VSDNYDRLKILEEVAKFTQPPRLEPDDFTVRMYAEENDITYAIAARQLAKAHRAGKLTRRRVVHDGKQKWAYRLNKNQGESL
jgi:hypothetical protein